MVSETMSNLLELCEASSRPAKFERKSSLYGSAVFWANNIFGPTNKM